jgi:hypothetical protein
MQKKKFERPIPPIFYFGVQIIDLYDIFHILASNSITTYPDGLTRIFL